MSNKLDQILDKMGNMKKELINYHYHTNQQFEKIVNNYPVVIFQIAPWF